jgi:diguanylate cyclase (GGDEF)-like protein
VTTSVMLVDLDDFKMIDESRGHTGGHRVLKAVVAAPQDLKCASDLAFRHSGDECLSVMPAIDQHAALLVAQRVQASLGRLRAGTAQSEVAVACCAGVGAVHRSCEDVEVLRNRRTGCCARPSTPGRARSPSTTARPSRASSGPYPGENRNG